MAIDPIPLYGYPLDNSQSIFSKEEYTALELAGKTANKMNEVVQVANGIEQNAIESRQIVDNMQLEQENFVIENSNIRDQILADNGEFIADLTASKETFEDTLTQDIASFKSDLNTSKTVFEEGLNTSKETFETNMTEAVNNIITSADSTINTSVETKIDTLVNDGTIDNLINTQILGDVKEDIILNEKSINDISGVGVVSGLLVLAQSSPDMSVLVSQGIAHLYNGKRYTQNINQSVIIESADILYSRIDIIYINSDGLLSYGKGAASADPIAPSPLNALILAEILIDVGTNSITTNNITNMQSIKKSIPDLDTEIQSFITQTDLNFNDVNSQLAETVSDIVNVKTGFGAAGDGITDDTLAIQSAVMYATGLPKAILYFPSANKYLISDTIDVPANVSVIMESGIIYDGINQPALIVRGAHLKHKLDVERATLSDWEDENSIGIKLVNLTACDVEIMQSGRFTIGLQCVGDNGGFAYNSISLGELYSNKIGLDLTDERVGWCNENIFIGGRFTNFSGQGIGKSRYGIRITSKRDFLQNNNVFLKPSFELNVVAASPNQAIPILIEHGAQNTFEYIRNENNSYTTAIIKNKSATNHISTGYGNVSVDDQSETPSTDYISIRTALRDSAKTLIFDSGALHKKATHYDSTRINIQDVFVVARSNGTPLLAHTGFTIKDDCIEMLVSYGRGIGIYVDTSVLKRFVVRRSIKRNKGTRINIKCFGVNGQPLTSTDVGHPFCKGSGASGVAWSTACGGSYDSGVDSSDDFYFTVTGEVDSIAIYITNGTGNAEISSFAVYAIDSGYSCAWSGFEEYPSGVNIVLGIPTSGKFKKNQLLYNDNAAAGEYSYYRCMQSGEFGTSTEPTFKGVGMIEV